MRGLSKILSLLTSGEEIDSVEEFLETDLPILVFVDAVEHPLHEEGVRLHAEGVREFVFRQGRPHHHDDVAADILQLPSLARLQSECLEK